jgi:hypothetical protein
MTSDRSVPRGELFLTPGEAELHRQLLEQFYKDSAGRYGIDSEQARGLSRLLVPADSAGPPCDDRAILHSTQ